LDLDADCANYRSTVASRRTRTGDPRLSWKSRSPFRAQKTHEVNQRALKHLRKMFENTKLAELTADDIETYLRQRLKQHVLVKAKAGFV
jgi:predicted small metal-binding protein